MKVNTRIKIGIFTVPTLALAPLFTAMFLCSCSPESDPQPIEQEGSPCYQVAKALEMEQFEAYQDFQSTDSIQRIRRRYERENPECRW